MAKGKQTAQQHGAWGGAYFLGMIGAAVYYVQHSHTFWTLVLGLLKALVWPVFVVHHVLALTNF